MLTRIISLVSLLVVSQTAAATILLGKDRVTQVNALTVLGNEYVSSYQGTVRGINPETRQDIALLVQEDADGNAFFDGVSTNRYHPNAEGWFYGLAESSFYGSGYNLRLNSDRWTTGAGSSDPTFNDVYYDQAQDSYIDFQLNFRVDGEGGSIYADYLIEYNHVGSSTHALTDHTTGMVYDDFYSVSLQDGHVYTFNALVRNWSSGEHSVDTSLWFSGDTVEVPEPSTWVLLMAGLAGLGLNRKFKKS